MGNILNMIETATKNIEVNTDDFLANDLFAQLLKKNLVLKITENTYPPKVSSNKSDWVVTVALPAFQAYQKKYPDMVKHFCSIGTGCGVDLLAAIEVFNPTSVTFTDLHESVVEIARKNVEANLINESLVSLKGLTGSLASPLVEAKMKFNLIYENLPNIPLPDDIDILNSINSASYINVSDSNLQEIGTISNDLTELHFLFLQQAKETLYENGCVISSIGARRPLKNILEMPKYAGYNTRLLTYTWKIQSEAEEVLMGYAEQESKGKGPFYFYEVNVLEDMFSNYNPVEAANKAFAIEAILEKSKITATDGIELSKKGMSIGHTVAALKSTPA